MSKATSSPSAQSKLAAAGTDSQPSKKAQLGFMFHALVRDHDKLMILIACTLAAVTVVFEPQYLTLSTSFVQTGLRTPDSQAPMTFAFLFLILAMITLIAGLSADLLGRRLFLLLGLGGLMLSNVLGMFWLNSPQFVITDILNAITGVIVLPTAIAIVTLTFEPMVLPLAYGILFGLQGTAMVISPLIIPLFGGAWDGRAAFIPVLLIGLGACVMVLRYVSESMAPKSLRRGNAIVNLLQIILMFIVVYLIVTAQIRSEPVILGLAILAALLLFGAIARWLRQRVRYFKEVEVYPGRNLLFAILAGVMLMFAQGCFFYQITPYFYDVQEVGDLEGVLRFVPFVIGLLFGGVLVARLSLRFGARRILAFSFILMGVAMLSLSRLQVDSSYWVMLLPITLIGLASGLGGPARTQVVLGSPPNGLVSGASAVNTAAGQAGYSFGVIVSSVLVTQYADSTFLNGLNEAGVPAGVVARVSVTLQNFLGRLTASAYPKLPETVTQLTGVSYDAAFTGGMTQMFFWVGIAMFIVALAMYVGMHRGLRASMAQPAGVSEAAAVSSSGDILNDPKENSTGNPNRVVGHEGD